MGRKPRLSATSASGHDGGGSLRWLLTYADMITLLMAFFIMLYSMSALNRNRFNQVAGSIRNGFGSPVASADTIKPPKMLGHNLGVPWQVVQQIQRLVKKSGLEESIRIRTDERGLVVSLVTNKILFAKGQADLSPVAEDIIGKIAEILRYQPNEIRTEGHTCNLPVASDKYPSNWELSTARATNVVRFLVEKRRFPSERLSAAGYADSRPLVPNTCEANRAMNRRVDIVILK